MTDFRGDTDGSGLRICVITSRFNLMVTERLLEGARAALVAHGVDEEDIDTVSVPGAWELGPAARLAAERGYDALVAIGCVIRGETAHFELVYRAAAEGLARVQLETGVPIGLGLLTPESMSQAMARAGGEVGHAGVQAAEAALEMVRLSRRLRTD